MLRSLDPRHNFAIGLAGLLFLALVVVSLWMVLPAQPRAKWRSSFGDTDGLAVSPDGRALVSLHHQAAVIWDVPTGRQLTSLRLESAYQSNSPEYAWLAPDGETVALLVDGESRGSGFSQWRLMLWNWKKNTKPVVLPDAFQVLRFADDGRMLVTTDNRQGDGLVPSLYLMRLRLWAPATGQPLVTPDWDAERICAISLSAPGTALAVEDNDDQSLTVWDVTTRSERFVLHDAEPPAVISPDGKSLMSRSAKGAKLWDLGTGKELVAVEKNGKRIAPSQFSPDGTRLHVTVAQQTDPEFGGPTKADLLLDATSLPPPELEIAGRFEAFSPDSRWFAEVTDGSVRITSLGTMQKQAVLRTSGSTPRFAPDSATIAVDERNYFDESLIKGIIHKLAGKEEKYEDVIRVFDVASGRELLSDLECWDFLYAPDGKSLFTRCKDGTIHVWDVPPRRSRWVEYGLPVLLAVLILGGFAYWKWMTSGRTS